MHKSFRNGFEKRAGGQCCCPHCGNPIVLTAPVVVDPVTESEQTPQELQPPPMHEQAEATPQQQAGAAGEAGTPQQSAAGDRPPMQPQGPTPRSVRDYGEQYAGSQSPYSAMY